MMRNSEIAKFAFEKTLDISLQAFDIQSHIPSTSTCPCFLEEKECNQGSISFCSQDATSGSTCSFLQTTTVAHFSTLSTALQIEGNEQSMIKTVRPHMNPKQVNDLTDKVSKFVQGIVSQKMRRQVDKVIKSPEALKTEENVSIFLLFLYFSFFISKNFPFLKFSQLFFSKK